MCFGKAPKPVTLKPPPPLPEKPPEEAEITATREKEDEQNFGPGGKPQYRRADNSVSAQPGAGLKM
ncbi:hypothetical protein [Taklimakanibacter albus]|uniref:Uncharacterized protein n=1 Tax=Taklimakanibacter albus TaxID=2800327 RepID=A0ACC5RG35_9HYPH|nr:hypothetical protein [Aestuariivirga sp. YIM B02566]MBK1871564.1 hypothetical protein [Aestuariivirga sp. YIM B02566]